MSVSTSAHLVIFARHPRLGAGKRRLAAEVGELEALRFQRAALQGLVRRLGRDPRWRTWIAITPDRARLRSSGLTHLPQGEGHLGERLARAMRALPSGPVVIVGSDAPQVLASDIGQAFAMLRRADAVFGPATDGGYWLAGLSRRLRRGAVFEGVRWSTPHALRDTLANLRGRRVGLLSELEDVDDAQALRRVIATIGSAARGRAAGSALRASPRSGAAPRSPRTCVLDRTIAPSQAATGSGDVTA